MLKIAHRINTLEQLKATPSHYGIELDLRDRGDRLIVTHDPFTDGVDFERWLEGFRHKTLILNVKSERIEFRVLELLRHKGIEDYFFLDCSFPMIRTLLREGERRIAIRYSEFEPIEGALALAGQIDWIWVDCFTKMPLESMSYARLKQHFKLCAVSPELQGRSPETIRQYHTELAPYPMDAVCTKRPDLWEAAEAGSLLRAA